MRITNYPHNYDIEDIETLTITIKAIPFEGYFVPAFVLISPDDDYSISLDEVNCLMDGIEIANKKIDDLITYILRNKIFNDKEGFEDDNGEGDS
jgi:hypothetical protein